MRILISLIAVIINITVFAESLKIGVLPFAPPFEMQTDQSRHFTGFDIDLMSEICTRIKTDCSYIPLSADQLFLQVLNGDIDLAISSLSITPQRLQNYLFSLPYLASSGQFLTGKPSTLTTISQLQGKTVGVLKGTIFKEFVSQILANKVTIKEFAAQDELLQAAANHDIDAIILDTGSAKYWVANNSTVYQLIDKPITIGTGYGIMANQSRQDIIDSVNQALIQIENDGTYLKIYSKYFSQLPL